MEEEEEEVVGTGSSETGMLSGGIPIKQQTVAGGLEAATITAAVATRTVTNAAVVSTAAATITVTITAVISTAAVTIITAAATIFCIG